MKTLKELLDVYYKADKERDTARQDWVDADAEATLMIEDKQLHRAAIDARQEAAKRWLTADLARSEAAEDIGERHYER